jgi:SNF2 family DNA or RNA helicase
MTVWAEKSELTDHIHITAEWRFKELCKTLPGASWSTSETVWKIPLSWSSCLALRSTFREQLQIGPQLTEWAKKERETRIDPAVALRDIEEQEEGDADLFPHQRAGVSFLSVAKRALLADEPGLGKTAQAIRALKKIKDSGEDVFPALIVCPNTLKANWEREFERWWPDVKTQVVRGTATQRRKQLSEEANVYIINWEALRGHSRLSPYGSIALARCSECGGHDSKVTENRCEVHIRELNEIDFKAVVADEIHRSKDPKSKQTRALWSASGSASIRFALTGTPIANDVLDLWPILHWLSPKDWPSKTKWIDRMVDTMVDAFGQLIIIGVKPTMQEEFQSTINPYMRRMLKARVLPWLPPVIRERRDVEMSPKQKKAYDEMRKLMMTQLEDGELLTASSPLTQTTRLVQFANSYATMETNPLTGESRAILAEPSCKVDALMSDIKNGDFKGESVAVCAVSRQLIYLLSAEMDKAGIPHGLITGAQDDKEREEAVAAFQSGRIKWILFTAQAGGVGITLTAARRLIMLQRPWSLVDYKQALDRVHRIGSEIHDSIIITDYITEKSIESRIIRVLGEKAESFEEIVQDRKKLLSALLEEKD